MKVKKAEVGIDLGYDLGAFIIIGKREEGII